MVHKDMENFTVVVCENKAISSNTLVDGSKPEAHRFTSGAASSQALTDFTKVPLEAIQAIATRFDVGDINNGGPYSWDWQVDEAGNVFRGNYKKGKDDPSFIRDRFAHAITHAFRLASGVGTVEDLQAVLCNFAMLAWFQQNGTGFGKVFPNAKKS